MAQTTTAIVDVSRTPAELAEIVAGIAARPEEWIERVRLRRDRRWYLRLRCEADHDVWLISWLPGQGTGFHDHGGSSGAFAVAAGVLEEERPGQDPSLVHTGDVRHFGRLYAHDVRNPSSAPAISIHAYSPPLAEMTRYELDGDELVPDTGDAFPDADDARADGACAAGRGAGSRIDALLAASREKLHRLSPLAAHAALVADGAVLVDIRPAAQRAIEGDVPGAIVIERNVLEWRLDPTCDARLDLATGYDVKVIVICSEGYTSSLAAASLQDIGLWQATDVIGGVRAWRDAGLPVG